MAVPDDSLVRGLLARIGDEQQQASAVGGSAQFFAQQGRLKAV